MDINKIINENQDFLQGEPHVYFSPGRVNLIGEYIDFLGGSVFPAAISLGTYAFVTKREDNELHFLSLNFKQYGTRVATLDKLEYKKKDNWINFGKGMFDILIKKGATINHGLNILIFGTLPNSSGLSSSASLEVLIGEVIRKEYNFDIDMFELVQLAQKVENQYIGVNCGIMDQFSVGMSKKDTAILLNTDTLDYEYVPLHFKEYKLVVANSNKKRALTESKYNERRAECDKGLEILQSFVEIKQLCDLDPIQFEIYKPKIKNYTIKKRVEHAIYENERTKKAVIALQNGQVEEFAEYLNKSHYSLQHLFEVTGRELDTLQEALINEGAIGARMTGAGFGGCVIALIHEDHVQQVIENVSVIYKEKIGYQADFYVVETSDGAKQIGGKL